MLSKEIVKADFTKQYVTYDCPSAITFYISEDNSFDLILDDYISKSVKYILYETKGIK